MEGNIEGKKSGANFTLATCIYLLFSLVYSVYYTYMNTKTNNEFGSSDIAKFLPFILGSCITFVTCVIIILKDKIKYKEKFKLIEDKKHFTKYNFIALPLITIGFIFGLGCLNFFFVEMLEGLGFKIKSSELPSFSISNFLLVILFVCIMPSLTEELIFRKFILSGIKGLGIVLAPILSAVCFSLYHMNPAQTVYQLLVGVVFAIVVLKTREILFVIIPHLINNIYIILNEYFFHLTFELALNIVFIIIGLICLSLGLYIVISKNDKVEKSKVDIKSFFTYGLIGFVITTLLWIVGLFN